jgi:NADH-quinone oxidoreductase subunit E
VNDKVTSPKDNFSFDENNEKRFQATLKKYPTKMAALLPTLWLCQHQNGYLTNDILEYVAERLDLSPVHVYSVAEFYTMYHKRPPGQYHLQLCRTLSCVMCGAEMIRRHLRDAIGIEPGEQTEDGMFSLEEVECLGSCGTAPVLRVNDVYCENLTIEKLDKIISICREGGTPEEEPMGPH